MRDDAALWRKYAQVYDEVFRVIPYRNMLVEAVDRADIKDDMNVLDACCGTGNLLWALQQQGIRCHVTGIDYSNDMLTKAAPKTAKYDGQVTWLQADLDEPVETWGTTKLFDRVILNNCLWVLPKPAEIIKKVGLVAREGAILIASTPRPNPNVNELMEEHLQLSENAGVGREEAVQLLMPKLQPLLKGNEALMKRYGDSQHLPGEPQLRGWFEGSGWKIRDITTAYAGQNWQVVAVKETSA